MRLIRLVFLAVFCSLLWGSEASTRYAFVDVNVAPMTSRKLLKNYTVLVEGEKISKLGPSSEVEVPSDVERIDGQGFYLVPGFAEMHGHIPPPEASKEYLEEVLFLYVANGVTTVRGMLGAPGQLELRDKIEKGEILGPTLYLAGPSFSGRSIDSPDAAREKVRLQTQEGWDLLKIHPGLTRSEYDAMAETARQAGIEFSGHVPSDVGILHALDQGQTTIDHLDGYIEFVGGTRIDDSKLNQVARKTRERGAWVVPTMVLWETILGVPDLEKVEAYPELRYMPADILESWKKSHGERLANPRLDRDEARKIAQNRKRLLRELNQAGVSILFGTDAPQQFSVPGFSIHREIESMKDSGLSDFEILRSGTANVGEYLKNKGNFGTIEPGKRADLILLRKNPLDNASHLKERAGVMVRGRWLPEKEIKRRLESIAR